MASDMQVGSSPKISQKTNDAIERWLAGADKTPRPETPSAPSGGGNKNGQSHYTIDTGSNIARVPDTTPKDAVPVSDKARANNDYARQDVELGQHNRRQSAVDSSYTDDPNEWFRRYRYWNWNLAKDNPRGNLNGMSFGDTRLYSRLADALNNERHLKPTDIGRRTLNYGATGTGADNAGSERWEPIETQEMRQMRANERLDERARGYDIDRQKSIEDYPLEMRKNIDKAMVELNKYSSQTGIDFERLMQRGIFEKEYGQSWDTYWNTLQHRFAVELGQDLKERIFAKLSKLEYPLSQLYSTLNGGGSVPTPLITAVWKAVEDMAKGAGSSAEAAGIMAAGFGTLAALMGEGAIELFKSSATSVTRW